MTDLLRMVSSVGRREPLRAIVPADTPPRRPGEAEAQASADAFGAAAAEGEPRDWANAAGSNSAPSHSAAAYRHAVRSYSTPFLAQFAAQAALQDEVAQNEGAGPPSFLFSNAAASYRRTSGLNVEILGAHAPVDFRA